MSASTDSPTTATLTLIFLVCLHWCVSPVRSQLADGVRSQLREWPSASLASGFGDGRLGDEDGDGETVSRRSLYWPGKAYISYAALAANRVPCPPRSGRSYYTHNCYSQRTPVNPYNRGCLAITRCSR